MPTERSLRPRDRKEQIATVAADLFHARGFHGVAVNDIAAATGITGPALYRHFADKRAILSHVVLSGVREMESAVTEAARGGQEEDLLVALATTSLERRNTTALWRREGRNLSDEDQRELSQRSHEIINCGTRILLGVRHDLAAADAELLSWAALSVFGSVAMHHTTVPKRRFVRLLVEIAQRVLRADLPPRPEVTTPFTPGVGTRSRREALISAAAELFHQRGFHSVSMDDIGSAAGIAGPSVYRHFPSKAALLNAIARRAADRLALGAEHALRTSATETEALRELVDSYVAVLTRFPELAVAFSVDGINLTEQDRADLLRIERDYVRQWRDLLCPGLNPREANITVHAALTIANDLTRTRRTASRPHLPTELVTLMTVALGLTGNGTPHPPLTGPRETPESDAT
jgi:AcrR family transcriptional regulator